MSQHIAIIEDDIDQQQNYADALHRKGFKTSCYSSVDEALTALINAPVDLVLLDVVLGDDQDGGFTICRKLLDQGRDLPIIFLSDRSEEIDQVFGLRLGAWDYQTKPISLALLTERIKSLLRIYEARKQSAPGPDVSSDHIQLDMDKSYVAWHGTTVPLTLTEFRLLVEIIQAGAEGVSYATLCDSTMQRMVTNGTINSHIKNIRKKFNAVGPTFDCIHNKPGFGYRWERS